MTATIQRQPLDMLADVLDFHAKFGCLINDLPTLVDDRAMALRYRLVREEGDELREAMEEGDLVGIADAIADSVYVLLGTAVAYGIDIRPVWQAVHAANMAKVGGGKRADGKILKPDGWQPPHVRQILDDQQPLRKFPAVA